MLFILITLLPLPSLKKQGYALFGKQTMMCNSSKNGLSAFVGRLSRVLDLDK